MNRNLWYALLIAAVLPLLGGCADAIMLTGQVAGQALNNLTLNMEAKNRKADADSATVTLVTPTSSEAFIGNVRTIAGKFGYRVENTQAIGKNQQFVMLSKNDWGTMYSVNLVLDEDATTIHVNASVHGNGAESGAGTKVAKEFAVALNEKYASR